MRVSRSLWLAVILLTPLIFAGSATGSYDPVGSGWVHLRFDPAFVSYLQENGIKLGAAAPARLANRQLSLPVVAGTMDPTAGRGSFDTEGGLILNGGSNRVPFRDITLKTKRSPLIAKVGGSQLKVAAAKGLKSRRSGFGTTFAATHLRLSSKVAVRLNKKLRPQEPFRAGQIIGSVTTKASPLTVTLLPQGRATLELDPGFGAKLGNAFVSVNPISPAEHIGPTFTFPILSGSTLSPAGDLGTMKLGGSMEFLQLSTDSQLFLQEFWLEPGAQAMSPELDLEPVPPFSGKLGRRPAFTVAPGLTGADAARRTITVTAATIRLTAESAGDFNDLFAKDEMPFGAGEVLGRLSFVAQSE